MTTLYDSIPTAENSHDDHVEEEEEEEEDPKVSTLELFSDLVMVVSIHVVAEPLEDEEAMKSWAQIQLYVCRVFFLWLVWHMVTLLMNAAVKMQTQNCPIYHSVMFLWMACVLKMAQAFSAENDRTAIGWYLALRLFETAMFARQVYFPYCGAKLANGTCGIAVTKDWLTMMQNMVRYLCGSFVVCEVIPMSLALVWGVDGEIFLTPIYVAIILIVGSFVLYASDLTIFGFSGGKNHDSGGDPEMTLAAGAFDSDHLQERYELITLIFTGELCFAAGKHGNSVAASAVLIMAFCTYLLTFKSHPPRGHVTFWARSFLHSVAGLFLYAGVFCAIPAMGSAFARIIEGNEEEKQDDEEEEVESPENETGNPISASDLLCYSAAAFMLCTALMNIINKDPHGPDRAPKLSAWKRGTVRIICGLVILALPMVVSNALRVGDAPIVTVLVPVFALISTVVEIWAVGSLQLAL